MLIQTWGEATTDPDVRGVMNRVFVEVRVAIIDALTRWAQEHPDAVDGPPAAWAARMVPLLMGLVQGFALQHTLIEGFEDEAYLEAIVELLPS
jgi:hypothetical protein